MKIKESLYNVCLEIVNERHTKIQERFSEIQEAMLSETKSSAGDKHETGRAMLQLEREKIGNQLAEIQKVKETLYKIDSKWEATQGCLGSIVYTSQANYFIAVSVGKLIVNNDTFYAIATNTPIGKLLLGKKVGDEVTFRDQSFVIQKIF
ncbi:3-oxoacyl-ACP synthase [Kordia zhangzhouensis]|uniref:3-oxoacyl-ACP synthase n=1 Tax=Kordia zhangzhouensis TaxID=1620405 RepID=UPI000629B41B|nr:3-oxoacyl-ACP synthase [Kordia zhangzhouensis]